MLNNNPLTDSFSSSTPNSSNVDNLSTGGKEEKKQVFGVSTDSLDAHGALNKFEIGGSAYFFSNGMKRAVERGSGLTWGCITSTSRRAASVGARTGVSVFLRHAHPTPWSFHAIGQLLSRDHSTVIHAISEAENITMEKQFVAFEVYYELHKLQQQHGVPFFSSRRGRRMSKINYQSFAYLKFLRAKRSITQKHMVEHTGLSLYKIGQIDKHGDTLPPLIFPFVFTFYRDAMVSIARKRGYGLQIDLEEAIAESAA